MDMGFAMITVAEFALIGWIIWVAVNFTMNKSRQRSEERLRMLDRFSTGQELADFLASETGQQFLATFTSKPSNPRKYVLLAIWCGVICILTGAGSLGLVAYGVFNDPDVYLTFLVSGFLAAAVGGGILICGAITNRLIRKWRLNSADQPATP